MVPTVTPATETPEIMLITLCDFFDLRYLQAMKIGSFKVWKLRVSENQDLSRLSIFSM